MLFSDRTVMVAVSWLLCGCTTHHYEITMTPQGDRVERSLTVSVTNGSNKEKRPTDDAELTLLSKAYGHPVLDSKKGQHAFLARFQQQLPQDVGGHGTYVRFESPCGEVTAYIERFRGSYDLVGEFDARREAAGKVIDLLVRWTKKEWGTTPFFPTLREKLTTTIRRDLENLGCMSFVLSRSVNDTDQVQQEWFAHVSQFLIERQYVLPSELPSLINGLSIASLRDDPVLFDRLIQEILLRQLGLDEDEATGKTLSSLVDMERSLSDFLRTTPEYREQLRIHKLEKNENALDPLEVISEPLSRALLPPQILRATDHVALSVLTGQLPFYSNGVWQAERATVEWDLRIEARENIENGHEFPRHCFAVWAHPNLDFQRDHFGAVRLDTENLLLYCLWYRGLSAEAAAEWDTFLNTVHPDKPLADQLHTFRFRDDPPPKNRKRPYENSLAHFAISLLLDDAKEKESPQ